MMVGIMAEPPPEFKTLSARGRRAEGLDESPADAVSIAGVCRL